MTPRTARFVLLAASLAALGPAAARANGLVSHVHIADLALEALPPGDLRDLLADPALLEVYRAGSVFPDTGYAADDPYGEMAHWEPFTEAYLQYIRETYGPDFESPEARQHVAFLMGQASHSMADQWFDSLFMARVEQYDGSSEELDTGAEPWLIVEHQPDAEIEGWVDAATINRVFAEELSYEPSEATIERGMELVVTAIRMLYLFAEDLYESYWRQMPWGATHYYLGQEAPGSLPHIAEVVARYWQVLWLRLHDQDEPVDSFLMSWPPDGFVNFEVDPASIETRIAAAFGHGVDRGTLTEENVRLLDAGGSEVPSRARFIYGSEFGNVVLVRPRETLEYDQEYTLELGTGLVLMDRRSPDEPVRFSFRTRCAPDRLEDCPPLPDPWEPPEGPPELPGDEADAGPDDAGPDDAEPADADQLDAGADAGEEPDVEGGGCEGCRAGGERAIRPLASLALGFLG